MSVEVTYKGPLFSEDPVKVVDDMIDRIETELGQVVVDQIKARLDSVLQHPTGYYKSNITATNAADSILVSDRGVVYGPWLEGISSRNKTTKFKGYSTFRRVTQEVNAQVDKYAEPIVERELGRLR